MPPHLKGNGKEVSEVRIIERIAGHYEIQDMEDFATVYRWHPETVVVECECGEKATFKRSEIIDCYVSACQCGKDDMAGIREELVIELLEEDEDLHPWRSWRSSVETGIPF